MPSIAAAEAQLRAAFVEDRDKDLVRCPMPDPSGGSSGPAVTDRPPDTMTQPDDLARIVAFVLDLPNTASIATLPINCTPEESL